MNKSSESPHTIRCNVSAWVLTLLAILWSLLSFVAVDWLSSMDDWRRLGPLEVLCLSLLVIQLMLIVATLYSWRMKKPEALVVQRGSNFSKRSAALTALFLICTSGLWVAGGLEGWMAVLTQGVGTLGFCGLAVVMTYEIRKARKMVGRKPDAE